MILALTGEMQQRVKNWGKGYKIAPPPHELFLSGENILETLRNVIFSLSVWGPLRVTPPNAAAPTRT